MTLLDGTTRPISPPPEKNPGTVAQSQGEKLVSKLRDYEVPYSFAT